MAIFRKAPNGELLKFPDGTTEEEISKQLEQVQQAEKVENPEGLLNDVPDALKKNWLYDTAVVAPYEASRKAINSTVGLVEQLSDTLGEKTTFGGFRYGSDANNNLIEYVPYDRAIKELNESGKKTYGILSPLTGAIGVKDAYNIQGFFYDPTNPDNDNHTTSLSGNLVEGIGQFIIGFKGVDKLFKAGKIAPATTKIGSFGQASVKGAVADFTVFDENSGRLTDLLAEYAPETVDNYLDYLQSDENDSFYEARFKNALEGLALGGITEAIFRGTRFVKNIRNESKNAKQIKEDKEYLEKTNEVFDTIKDKLDEATSISDKMKILNDALDAGEPLKFKTQKKITESQQIVILNNVVKKNLKSNFEKWQKGEINADEAFNIPEGFINLETFKPKLNKKTGQLEGGLSFEGLKTFKSFYDAVSKVNKGLNKRVTDEAVRRKAVNDYGGDVNKVFQDFSKFADNVQNTESLIFAHEVAYTSLLNAFPKFVRQYKSGGRTKEDMQMFMFMLENMTVNSKRVRSATGRNLRVYQLTKDEFAKGKEIEQEFLNSKNAYLNFGGGEKAFDDFLDRMARADSPTVTRQVLNFALKNKAWNVANEVWINALLSSPKTQLVNALSNGVVGLLRPLEDAIGNKASELISKGDVEKAKVYKRNFEESIDRYAGMVEYLGTAVKYTKVAFKNGELVLQSKDAGASKLDTATDKAIKNKFLGGAVRLPSRFLNAGDEFFKQINYRSKLKSQAIREAKLANLKNKKDIQEFVDEYIKQGYDETGLRGTNEEALRYAEENTFTNELVGFTDRFSDLVNSYPVLKQFFPFVKTPTNIAKAVADRTPLALFYRGADIFGRSGDPVAIAKARGQLAVGSILLGTAYTFAKMGMISGQTGYSGDKPLNKFKDAELLRLKKSGLGFRPYSIKLSNGVQIPFGQLDPIGALFGIMADFVQLQEQMTEAEIERFGADMNLVMLNNGGKNPLDFGQKAQIFLGAGANAVRRNIFSKTYLRALTDITDAMMSEDERTLQRWWSGKVGSFVPNILRKFVNDPYYRDATTVLEEVRNRTGFGQPSSPRYNAIGEAHKDSDGFVKRFFKNAINPLGTTKIKKDIVAEEIIRLGVGLTNIPKYNNLVEYPQFKKGNMSAYDRINQIQSTIKINGKTLREALENEIGKESYKRLGEPITIGKGMTDEGGKVQRLKFIHEMYKQKAFREFEGEKKDYKSTKNEKLSLKDAEKVNEKNNTTISRPRRPDTKLKLQPLYNFGN